MTMCVQFRDVKVQSFHNIDESLEGGMLFKASAELLLVLTGVVIRHCAVGDVAEFF